MGKQSNTGNGDIQPLPTEHRLPKRWVLAKRKNGHMQIQVHNECVEGEFLRIVYKVKALLKNHGETVFERDYKHDNTENAMAMHAFMSRHIYLYLECSFNFVYQVEFAFNNCPLEQTIRDMLSTYILRERTKEVNLQPDFATFFKSVFTVQDSRHIFTL